MTQYFIIALTMNCVYEMHAHTTFQQTQLYKSTSGTHYHNNNHEYFKFECFGFDIYGQRQWRPINFSSIMYK